MLPNIVNQHATTGVVQHVLFVPWFYHAATWTGLQYTSAGLFAPSFFALPTQTQRWDFFLGAFKQFLEMLALHRIQVMPVVPKKIVLQSDRPLIDPVELPDGASAYGKQPNVTGLSLLRNDVRRELQNRSVDPALGVPLGTYDPDRYDKVVHIGNGTLPIHRGAIGQVNQHDIFVDAEALLNVDQDLLFVILHEIGHAFGAQHADLWNPHLVAFAKREKEYGDPFDLMGTDKSTTPPSSARPPAREVRTWKRWTRLNWYNPWVLERAGWLDDTRILSIDATSAPSAPVELEPIGRGSGIVAIRVRVTTGTTAWIYWRRYEKANGSVENDEGPVVVFAYDSTMSRTILYNLNARQESGRFYDWAEAPMKLPAQGATTRDYQVYDPEQVFSPAASPNGQEWLTIRYHGIRPSTVQPSPPQQPADVAVLEFRFNPAAVSRPAAPVIGIDPTLLQTVAADGHRVRRCVSYRVTAYLPGVNPSPTNGEGISRVRMGLYSMVPGTARSQGTGEPENAELSGVLKPQYPVELGASPLEEEEYPPGGLPLTPPPYPALPAPVPATFELTVDTLECEVRRTGPVRRLPDGIYTLIIEATSTAGTKMVAWWVHMIDNDGALCDPTSLCP